MLPSRDRTLCRLHAVALISACGLSHPSRDSHVGHFRGSAGVEHLSCVEAIEEILNDQATLETDVSARDTMTSHNGVGASHA